MREQLLAVLKEARPDVNFETETKLIDNKVLDSFDFISIIGELNEVFEVEITADELCPENFNSVDAMLALIVKLQED